MIAGFILDGLVVNLFGTRLEPAASSQGEARNGSFLSTLTSHVHGATLCTRHVHSA